MTLIGRLTWDNRDIVNDYQDLKRKINKFYNACNPLYSHLDISNGRTKQKLLATVILCHIKKKNDGVNNIIQIFIQYLIIFNFTF